MELANKFHPTAKPMTIWELAHPVSLDTALIMECAHQPQHYAGVKIQMATALLATMGMHFTKDNVFL